MNTQVEEILLSFTNYTLSSFRAEIHADKLFIEWGDGDILHLPHTTLTPIFHRYEKKGTYLIKISGRKIIYANFSRLNLTKIILHHCYYLEYLNCAINELQVLEPGQCPSLEELHCNSNNLENLYLNHNPKLSTLNASHNVLTALELGNCRHLHTLYCSFNRLTTLELHSCTKIYHLDLSNNLFEPEKLNRIFLQLPERNADATICYTGNPGVGSEDPNILKIRRWR